MIVTGWLGTAYYGKVFVARGTIKRLLPAVVGLALSGPFAASIHAAPILGETQLGQSPVEAPVPAPADQAPGSRTPADQQTTDQAAAPPGLPPTPSGVVSARATVLEFTILPSRDNPDELETTIILQQGGDNVVCVNHASDDIVVRSYAATADPFDPDVPSAIEGQDSGHAGELAGYNSEKLFIKPNTPDDRFDALDEPFTAGGFEGVFEPDEVECDELLTEGQTVCVDEVIRAGDCAFVEHANLERELRLMLALNSVPIIAPAAGGPFARDTGQVFGVNPPVAPGGGLPSGAVGAAPNFSGSFSGSGGGALITVPNVIGLPLTNAIALITGEGLAVGTITASQGNSTGLFDGVFITRAYAQSFPEGVTADSPVVDQSPVGGTQVAPGTGVSLVAQAEAVPVPEPSTLSVFAIGLLIVLAVYWYVCRRRRRSDLGA